MNASLRRNALIASVGVFALALAGCGGSGGGGPQPIPLPIAAPAPPAPPPPPPPPPPPVAAPTPPPAPAAASFNDPEYQRSNGANAHGALSAYNAGGTGRGVKVGVVDSGINPNLPEFIGRIDPASADLVASRGVSDTEGHGTAVSAVIAANRDGLGILGVAFESTLISLNTSNPEDCTEEDGCKHSSSAIARAVDLARTAGARVINISLGGESAGASVLAAVNRATQSGIVVVISAGNDGEEAKGANPDGFALQNAQLSGNGLVIIAGAVDANRQSAAFSNKAGTGAQFYLNALGHRVRTVDHTGTAFLYSGTSFSAPVISGAAALLASAFPNLTGAQIVQLLLTTADEAGETGTDAIYGRGILNITRAFSPQGATSLAGSNVAVSTSSNGQGSGSMGDAMGKSAMRGAIILDGYSRAYALDLAQTISRARAEEPLAQSLQGDFRTANSAAGGAAVSITVQRNLSGQRRIGMAPSGYSYDDARQAKLVTGTALSRVTKNTAIGFGFSESGRSLQQRLAGHAQNAFLVARDPMTRSGFQADDTSSAGIRHQAGALGVTLTGERGEVWNRGFAEDVKGPRYNIGAVTADRRIGPALVSLTASRLDEESTVLGGRFGPAFTSAGATSHFADASASFDIGRGWGAFASYRRGWTNLSGTGGLVENGRMGTDAWAFDLSKRGAFSAGDKLALRVMQPLRVRSGGFNLSVPTSYDYATLSVGYEDRQFSLSPSGREIDLEAAYSRALFGGNLGLNAFYRMQPGHIEDAKADLGAAIRFTLGF